MTSGKCPGCGASSPTDQHLQKEYQELTKASFDRMFGHNAERARREVARLLIYERGVREIYNIFGPIQIDDPGPAATGAMGGGEGYTTPKRGAWGPKRGANDSEGGFS